MFLILLYCRIWLHRRGEKSWTVCWMCVIHWWCSIWASHENKVLLLPSVCRHFKFLNKFSHLTYCFQLSKSDQNTYHKSLHNLFFLLVSPFVSFQVNGYRNTVVDFRVLGCVDCYHSEIQIFLRLPNTFLSKYYMFDTINESFSASINSSLDNNG